MSNQTRVERYQQAIEEAITDSPRVTLWSKIKKAIKVTVITAASLFALLVTCLIVDIVNDTPEEKAAYMNEQPKKETTKKTLPQEVKVAGTQSIDYKRATLRQILSQRYPMVGAYEVVAVENGQYHLVDVDPAGNDQGTFALEGEYQVGDVVVIMWADDSGEEIAGSVKLASASELDAQWNKAGDN